MKAICVKLFILICLGLTSFGAESDWFVVLDATNGFYASPGVPEPAIAALKQAQSDNAEIKSFAFTTTGDWLVTGLNNFWSSDEGLPVCQKLKNHAKNHKCVGFTSVGGWYFLWGWNGYLSSGSFPDAASKIIGEVLSSGRELQGVFCGTGDGWIIVHDKNTINYGGLPDDLAKVLDQAITKNTPIQCVAFSGTNWICLAKDEWWASDTNLPAAKVIEQDYKLGQHPKWVSFVPTLGPFNPRKFGTVIRQAMAGKLAGGYECEVIDHGKIVVALAEGWARAPWEKVDPAEKMTINSQIELASVSKPITSVALLKLWEECAGTSRQFSLDDPFWPHISEMCPDVNEDVKKITIRQVLMHRSGFTNELGHDPKDLRKLLSLPLAHAPGTHSRYQGINYYIIHLLIEQISQMDCTTYVKTHVLAPMGITDMDSSYHYNPKMCFYGKPGSQDQGDGYQGDNSSFVGPGGWYGSAADMGKFLEGIRQNRVLTPATTKMMLKQNLGWDFDNPWYKGGMVPGSNGREIHTDIYYFYDNVDAVILLNCVEPTNCGALPIKAWKEARY